MFAQLRRLKFTYFALKVSQSYCAYIYIYIYIYLLFYISCKVARVGENESAASTHSMVAVHWNQVMCQNSWGPERPPIFLIDRSMFIEGWLVDPVINDSIKPMSDGKESSDDEVHSEVILFVLQKNKVREKDIWNKYALFPTYIVVTLLNNIFYGF